MINSGQKFLCLWLCLPLFFLSGCSDDKERAYLVGSWRMKVEKGLHMVLTFQNQGKWKLKSKIEGAYTKIVETHDIAAGTWQFEAAEEMLRLTCPRDVPEMNWAEGETRFEVLMLNKSHLKFESAGKIYTWQRLGVSDETKATEAKESSPGRHIKFDPFVVNIKPDELYKSYKWICAQMEAVVSTDEPLAMWSIHPRIRERVLFFLSSKRYVDVNTQKEIKALEGQLREILNPYFNDQLTALHIKRFITTGNEEAVKRFLEKSDAEQAEK